MFYEILAIRKGWLPVLIKPPLARQSRGTIRKQLLQKKKEKKKEKKDFSPPTF